MKFNDMPPTTSIDDDNVATLTKKKVDVSSKLNQLSAKDIVNVNQIGHTSCQKVELVNTPFQHKTKHKDASVNDNITNTIVEYLNDDEDNVTMITNDEKGDKEIVASGKIIDNEIIKDTQKHYD